MALDPPPEAKQAIAAWRDRLITGRDDLRPTAPDTLHLTLAFLGYRPEKEIEAIAAAVAGAVEEASPATLTPRAVVALPPRRPRLFALDLEDEHGAAVALQEAVVSALEAGRFFKREKRPFWPHVTLARVKRDRRAEPLPETPPPRSDPFVAAAVTLYRSTLRPQGALYEPLATAAAGRRSRR